MSDFKYEVAFSFLDRDRELALAVKDLLGDMPAFVYSDRREEITGQNGVDAYSAVFSRDARVIVVLFRDGWGATDWTAIEQTAITTHGLKLRWETVLLVKLDEHSLPVWVPPSSIYADFEKFGTTGLAAVTRNMVSRAGGTTKEETVKELAERAARELRRAEDRKILLTSNRGNKLARDEWENLCDAFTAMIEALKSTDGAPQFDFSRDAALPVCRDYVSILRSRLGSIELYWHCPYADTLSESGLSIEHFIGFKARETERIHQSVKPKPLGAEKYRFDIDSAQRHGWKAEKGGRFYGSTELARHHIDRLLDRVLKQVRDAPIFPPEIR
jgi:hypothetical protein